MLFRNIDKMLVPVKLNRNYSMSISTKIENQTAESYEKAQKENYGNENFF